jgi:DNA-binding CsgD family transcriptional regulator
MKSHEAPGAHDTLTAREREILQFFASGLSTAAIAKRLMISPVTVRNHSQRILAKLGVHSRLAAVARGYALRVLRVPPPEREPSS